MGIRFTQHIILSSLISTNNTKEMMFRADYIPFHIQIRVRICKGMMPKYTLIGYKYPAILDGIQRSEYIAKAVRKNGLIMVIHTGRYVLPIRTRIEYNRDPKSKGTRTIHVNTLFILHCSFITESKALISEIFSEYFSRVLCNKY